MKIDPLLSIRWLFVGRVINERHFFLLDGGYDDTIARKALADLLCSGDPIPRDVRLFLADAFYPEPDAERRLKFEPRNKKSGRPENDYFNYLVTKHIYDAAKRNTPVEVAVRAAAKRFNLGEHNAQRIWKTHWRAMVREYGELPPPKRGRKKK
jgi:hypothetical protein